MPRTRLLIALTLAAAIGHVRAGDWRMVTAVLRVEGAGYGAPYPTQRYNAHAVWFLADAGLEGRLFNEYPVGGFMSFWLAPAVQVASSGTMNVAREAMRANFAIGERRPLRAGEDYAAAASRPKGPMGLRHSKHLMTLPAYLCRNHQSILIRKGRANSRQLREPSKRPCNR